MSADSRAHDAWRSPRRRAAEALGVAPDAALQRALLETAAEEVERSSAFAERVRARVTPTSRVLRPSIHAEAEPLVPRSRIADAQLDPYGPPDPHYLARLYGLDQLPLALAAYSYASLRESAARLATSGPAPSAPLPRAKDALIALLVRWAVAEERYEG